MDVIILHDCYKIAISTESWPKKKLYGKVAHALYSQKSFKNHLTEIHRIKLFINT